MTPTQKQLVAYALRSLAEGVNRRVLDALGRAEIDESEHGSLTDAEADHILDGRERLLELELESLARLFEE